MTETKFRELGEIGEMTESQSDELEELRERFMVACIDGEMDVIDSMLADGFNVNFHYECLSETPLQYACSGTDPWVIDVVTKLIEHGADVDLMDITEETALDVCLCKVPFQEHVAQLLLDCSKLGINRMFVNNNNYLFYANSVETIKFLVKNGIDINNVVTLEGESSTKLDDLYDSQRIDCIDYLISIGGKRYNEL